MTEEKKRLAAVEHIVHDYANLISSGEMLRPHFDPILIPPANTHVQHAFLLNCRKLGDFFQAHGKKPNDMFAKHFPDADVAEFDLSVCKKWRVHIDKQLAHLTYDRLNSKKSWDGSANQPLLEELRKAWRLFRSTLKEPYKLQFKRQLEGRRKGEFERFDLE
ncbi:MAG: hypothetical protein ACR2L2_16145 [Acidobacteriota bacterium]